MTSVMKVSFTSIIIRILLLLLPIVMILVIHALTYDEHKYCTPTKHQHVDGFLGTAFLIIGWFFVWLFIMIVELIYKIIRRS